MMKRVLINWHQDFGIIWQTLLIELQVPLETPINRAVDVGEEFSAALHPLFTTLHLNTFSRIRLKKHWATSIINKTPRHFTN